MENTQENNVINSTEIVQEVAAKEPIKTEGDAETPEQINWKKFREAREKDRREKEAALKDAAKKAEENIALKAAIESLVNKQPAAIVSDEPEEDEIQKRVDFAIAKRDRENEQKRIQDEASKLPVTLNRTFTDFDRVCSSENLDYFEYHYPEIAGAFQHMPDSFEKWSSIYKAVKRFIPNGVNNDQNKLAKNNAKPQAISSHGATSVGDTAPRVLDDAKRAANWERMQKAMKKL